MVGGILRVVFLAIIGVGVSFAIATWHYLPADQSGAPLLDRVKVFSNRALADLSDLPSLQAELDIWKQAALTVDESAAQDTSDPAMKNLMVMTNTMKVEFSAMLEFRKRIDFWHDVALGTACLALGGLLGGLFRRRPRDQSAYD